MAAGPVTVIDRALRKIGAGEIDLSAATFAVALTTDAQALAADFAGASGEALYSDLTAEVSEGGTGYVTGGELLANAAWTRVLDVVNFTADPTAWESVTLTAKYAVIYAVTAASPLDGDILAIVDLEETNPSGRTSAGGDFTINWAATLFNLARASEEE